MRFVRLIFLHGLSSVYGFDARRDSGAVGEVVPERWMTLIGGVEERKFRLDRVRLSIGLWWRLSEVYADFFYSAMCGGGCWGGDADDGCRRVGTEEGEGSGL